MDRETAKVWMEAARYALGRFPRDRAAEDPDAWPVTFDPVTFGRSVASVRAKVPSAYASLAAVTRAAVEVLAPHRAGDAEGVLSKPEARAVKAVVVGYAFACQRGVTLPPHEREEALRLVEGMPTARLPWLGPRESDMRLAAAIPPVPAPDPGTGPVTFRFTWPCLRRDGRATRNVSGTGHVLPRRIAPDRAPVVARLAAPDGTWLDLRGIDGALYRPLLSPGSWTPVSLDAFAAAAAQGVPWRDNPFVPYDPDPYGPVQGAGDGWPPEGDVDASADRGRRDAALAACLAHAGELVVIDGIVHGRTEAPRLVVTLWSASLPDGRAAGPHLSWAFPNGPRHDASQATLSPYANWSLGKCMAPWLPEGRAEAALSFPLGSGEAARTFLEGLLPALEYWNGKPSGPLRIPVEVVDPETFPDDPEAVAEAQAGVRAILDDRSSGMPVDIPYYDEAEALSPDEPDELRVPEGRKERAEERAGRMAVAVVASLARARRLAADVVVDWSSFGP